MRSIRAAIVAGSALAMTVALVGCDPAVEPPRWQARLVGDQLQVAACEAINGDEISADVEQDTGPRWREFWMASGQVNVDGGGQILAGVDSPGIAHQEYDGSILSPDSTIIVFLYRDGDQIERAPFELNGDIWVRPDGANASSPCE